MEYRELGQSGLQVSVLALGAWQLGDPEYWDAVDHRQAAETVRAALDAGVTLFDTAEWYGAGESERALGRALGGDRARVAVASKVSPSNLAREGVRASCEASLRRLGTDTIDLYQVHWPNPEIPFDETWEALDALRREGKIRAVGVSNFGPRDLDAWMRTGDCVSNQIGYNALFRAPEYAVLPMCADHGVAVLAYMPLLQGILTGRWKRTEDIPMKRRRTRHFASAREGTMHDEPGAEDLLFDTLARLEALATEVGRPLADVAVAWLLTRPGVASAIVGGGKPDQVQRNVAAADFTLVPEDLGRIDEITEPLKARLGPNADMWKSGDAARIR